MGREESGGGGKNFCQAMGIHHHYRLMMALCASVCVCVSLSLPLIPTLINAQRRASNANNDRNYAFGSPGLISFALQLDLGRKNSQWDSTLSPLSFRALKGRGKKSICTRFCAMAQLLCSFSRHQERGEEKALVGEKVDA